MRNILAMLLTLSVIIFCSACSTSQNNALSPTENLQSTPTDGNTNQTESSDSTESTIAPTDDKIKLTKSASITYDHVKPAYSNLLIYKDGTKFGVLNNNGNIRIPAAYDRIDALDQNHIAYKQGAKCGILSLPDEVLVEGTYNNIAYVGADYVVLETATPCSANDSNALEVNGGYYKFTYQLFSLKTKSFVDETDLSSFTYLSLAQCQATENNLLIVNYIPSTKSHTFSVYYFDSKQWVELNRLDNWLSNGYTVSGQTIVDSCGNVTFNAKESGYSSILTSRGFEDIYFAFKDDSCILIDKDGKELFSSDSTAYNNATIQNNYIILRKDGYYGVIDRNGNTILPFRYKSIHFYYGNIFAVQLNDYWGFIDAQGVNLLDPTIEASYSKSDNCFRVGETACIINPYTGEIHKYQKLRVLDNNLGTFMAKNGNSKAIVTPTSVLTEFIYDDVTVSEDFSVYSARKGSTYDIYRLE